MLFSKLHLIHPKNQEKLEKSQFSLNNREKIQCIKDIF